MTPNLQDIYYAAEPFEGSLGSLVAPLLPQAFLADYWRQRSLFVKASANRMEQLALALGALDVGALLSQHRWLEIWRDCPGGREFSETGRSIDLALDAYHNYGATLLFHLRRDSTAHRWVTRLAYDLGEPLGRARVSIFAVRSGRGSEPHYDRNENFTIQLLGKKRWLVAPNGFINLPIAGWVMSSDPPVEAAGSLAPSAMPDTSREYTLEPGDMLYVPRGYLHHVTAMESDSLSINFCIGNTLIIDVLIDYLTEHLASDPALRRSLSGMFGSGWNRSSLRPEIATALRHFRMILRELSVDDCVTHVLERNPNTR